MRMIFNGCARTLRFFYAFLTTELNIVANKKTLTTGFKAMSPLFLLYAVLIVTRAYWISIRDYFSDLEAQKTRKVQFDKQRNRFDISCASTLRQLALPKDSGIYFAPLQENRNTLFKLTSGSILCAEDICR